MDGYEHHFTRAAEELKNAGQKGSLSVSDTQKINLYALFKQATEGDCKKAQPSVWQPVERAKWGGWNALQGVDSIVAKQRYVAQVMEIMLNFQVSAKQSTKASSATTLDKSLRVRPTPLTESPAEVHIPPPPAVATVATPAFKQMRENSTSGYVEEFARAAEVMTQVGKRKDISVTDAQKVKLYGLYKQATEGDCRKPQPSVFQPVVRTNAI